MAAQQQTPLTVRWEQVSIKHCDTQNILFQVLDCELHGRIPSRVQGRLDDLGFVFLDPHAHLTVRITFSWFDRIFYIWINSLNFQ